ncbi:MAG: HlyD family type I secretion periplasmic adaptor subunit [Deferribacterales bacterium]
MFKSVKLKEADFISIENASLYETHSKPSRMILWGIILFILSITLWASLAQVDEIVRSSGKIIPSRHVQVIQNLEGGIVANIYVQPGDVVSKGQKLIKIDNKVYETGLGENTVSANGLKARAVRLYAESNGLSMADAQKRLKYMDIPKELFLNETDLYNKDMSALKTDKYIIQEQINQVVIRNQELTSRIKSLKDTLELTNREISMTEPMVYRGAASKVDLIKLKKEYTSTASDIESSQIKMRENTASVQEYRQKLNQKDSEFRSKAQENYNLASADINKLSEKISGFEDQVSRSEVVSPVEGIVKQVYINTLGGVIKPGMDIMEIVPLGDKLEVEAKIKPSDIGFIHEGQKALIKLTAFDFSIYGGLEAVVTHVSPDTTVNEDEVYYIVKLQTDSSVIVKNGIKHKIIPGMIVSADIITGKKSIMSYILKPILKTKQAAFTER